MKLLAHLLVAGQFLAVLLSAWPFQGGWHRNWGPIVPLAAGLGLGLWTIAYNRPGNFHVYPQPLNRTRLVTNGPYRWVRHPMYSAVLLAAAGLAWLSGSWWNGTAWLMLLAVLYAKSTLEESLLRRRFSDYAAYQKQTGRFWPRWGS